jgi:hypothetical protein
MSRFTGLIPTRRRIMVGSIVLAAAMAASVVYLEYPAGRTASSPVIGSAMQLDPGTPIQPVPFESAETTSRAMGPAKNPYKRPNVVTRPDIAVTHAHEATEQPSPCRSAEGAWHLTAGGSLTLDTAGRARWVGGNGGRSEMISWLCHASGQIEIYLPTGSVRARQDATGDQLTTSATGGGTVLATR